MARTQHTKRMCTSGGSAPPRPIVIDLTGDDEVPPVREPTFLLVIQDCTEQGEAVMRYRFARMDDLASPTACAMIDALCAAKTSSELSPDERRFAFAGLDLMQTAVEEGEEGEEEGEEEEEEEDADDAEDAEVTDGDLDETVWSGDMSGRLYIPVDVVVVDATMVTVVSTDA